MSKRAGKARESLLDDDDVGHLGIKVNKEYAARFEHNKEREELHKLQARHPEMAARIARQSSRRLMDAEDEEGLEDESSSEEEDLGEIPDETEAKILETLLRIKRKDPAIYQSDVRFFEKEGEEGDQAEDEEGLAPKASKSKPKYLKDMIAQNLLKHGPEIEEDEEEEEEEARRIKKRAPKAYDDEQEQLRKAFISAAGDGGEAPDGDDFGGVLKPRAKQEGDKEEEEEEEEELDEPKKAKGKKGGKKKIKQLVDDFFGSPSKAEDSSERFLREYILNKGWEDKTGEAPNYQDVVGRDEEGDVDDEEDEQYLDEADRFEATYNFRFEEPGGTSIAVHPRVVEGLVRKTDDKRKRKRAEKAQRLEEERTKHSEEVKRLKNLKMKEIEDKVKKLQKVAGGSLAPTAGSRMMDALLEGDFDPEAWDREMQEAFDDGYYAEDDAELDALLDDLEDPELKGAAAAGLDPDLVRLLGEDDEDEDEETGDKERKKGVGEPLPKGDVEVGTYKALKKKLAEIHAKAQEEEEEEEEGDKEARAARHRVEIQRLMDEYYKLDFEDSIGGLRTRFKYKSVAAQNFGLSAEDILGLSDKDLNQVVGMKRLAPYRDEDERTQRPNYKALELLSSHQQSSKKGHKRDRERKRPQEDLKHSRPQFKKPRPEPSVGAVPKAGKAKGDADRRSKGEAKASAPSTQGTSKEEAMAARMASYAKLELRPGQGSKAKDVKDKKVKEKKKPQEPQASLLPPGLTKAQKKNFKRTLKRAKKD